MPVLLFLSLHELVPNTIGDQYKRVFTCKAEKDGVFILSKECASRDEARTNVCKRIELQNNDPKQPIKD
jgi:hypothetical protein